MIYRILKTSLLNIWPSIVIITITLVAIRFAYLKNHRESAKFYKEFWMLVAIIYMLMLYELVTRVDIKVPGGKNIVPFTEIMRYEFGSDLFVYNVIGNIVLFIPFGYIIASYIKPKKLWTNLFISIIVSTTIEFVQLNIGRSFDIDDIILNTLGGIAGFLIYIALSAIERHLPNFLKSDWLKNLICIIITTLIILYVLQLMGIVF